MQNAFELLRPRPSRDLRLLLHQVEIFLTPDIVRIVEERYERQIVSSDFQLAIRFRIPWL